MLNLRFELRHKQGLSLSPLPIGIVKQIVFIHILATQRRDIHLLVLRCPPHPTPFECWRGDLHPQSITGKGF